MTILRRNLLQIGFNTMTEADREPHDGTMQDWGSRTAVSECGHSAESKRTWRLRKP
jgi:hypothetical protein